MPHPSRPFTRLLPRIFPLLWLGYTAAAFAGKPEIPTTRMDDGSVIEAMKRGETGSSLGAGDTECWLTGDRGCHERKRKCRDGETDTIADLMLNAGHAAAEICRGSERPAADTLARFGMQLGERVGSVQRYPGYGIYRTSAPQVFARLRETQPNAPRDVRMGLDLLYAIPLGADWRQVLPVAGYEDLMTSMKEGDFALLPVPCDADPARDRFIEAVLQTRQNLPASGDVRVAWALDRQLMLCGREDEARSRVLENVEAGKWPTMKDHSVQWIAAFPESRPYLVTALLKAENADQAANLLEAYQTAVSFALYSPDVVRDYLAEGKTSVSDYPMWAFKPLIEMLVRQDTSDQCWPKRRALAQRAYEQKRYLTALTLGKQCVFTRVNLDEIDKKPKPSATLSPDVDVALRQTNFALIQAIGLIDLDWGRKSIGEEGYLSPFWQASNGYDYIYYSDYMASLWLPTIKSTVVVDTSRLSARTVEGHMVTLGPSLSQQEADRQKLLDSATGEARTMIARRDELLATIRRAEQAIAGAGSVEYRTEGRTAPSGIVNNTRIWTDQYGVQHTERTTSQQGGQNFSGTSLTLKSDTSASARLKRQAETELAEVERRLEALKVKTLSRYDAMKAEPPKRQWVDSRFVWEGVAPVTVSVSAFGRTNTETLEVDFSSDNGADNVMSQLGNRADERMKETLKRLTQPFIDARLNDWLHQVQGSAEEVEVETWLAQSLVWKNGGDFVLANLRMRGWVGE